MAQKDTPWYELIGQQTDASVRLLVVCEHYCSASSLKEIEDLAVTCQIPMVKVDYQIADDDNTVAVQGTYEFGSEGVTRFVLKDVLPLEQWSAYETPDARYRLETTVTLVSGHTVKSPWAFRCFLRSGCHTTQITDKSLQEQLASIPIANASMTEAQLRQICVDYIRLETEFQFKFQEDFVYTIESQKRPRRLLGGKVYGGMPYVSRGAGNLYRLAEVYDPETGTLSRDSDIYDNIRLFGNACSGAASMAWARVVNSAYLGYTMFMTEANGFLPVGPYRYPKENITRYIRNDPNEVCCRSLCNFNGEQTMFESYAQMQPADGLVCDGHVRMNCSVPVVVRNPDGTIDPDQSYIYLHEQTCYTSSRNQLRIAPDGSHYVAQGRVQYHNTFRQLWSEGYVPFTFREFKDPSLVEPARYRLAVEPVLAERVLTTNYPISDVFAELDGKRYVYRNMEFFRKEVKLGDIFPAEALTENTKLFCQLLNGQLLEVKQ